MNKYEIGDNVLHDSFGGGIVIGYLHNDTNVVEIRFHDHSVRFISIFYSGLTLSRRSDFQTKQNVSTTSGINNESSRDVSKPKIHIVVDEDELDEIEIPSISSLEDRTPSKIVVGNYRIKLSGTSIGSRQKTISNLVAGQGLRLVPQPDNPYDCYALLIVTASGEEVGYIPKGENITYFNKLKAGSTFSCTVASVIGSGSDGYRYGLVILLTEYE